MFIDDIAKWCNGQWLQHENNACIEELCIDTRKVAQPELALFFAFKTSNRDGHTFISTAYEKGIRNYVVTNNVDVSIYKGSNFIHVADALSALQQIAMKHRAMFTLPCIGITGSNGKTIVKEWLHQLLAEDYNIVRSPKSYNSQIGVPLSVALLRSEHSLAIFEAGISQPGEMEKLEAIVKPNIGIFTNIGEAHSQGFLNERQKINEKLFLFRNAKHLIYCKDHHSVNECVTQYCKHINEGKDGLKLFTWSQKQESNLWIKDITKENHSTAITALYKGSEATIVIPFTDNASIENTIHCWCAMLLLNVSQDMIAERMKLLSPVKMRLELRHGINDCTFINDTYNSDLTSLAIALEYLEQQRQHRKHTVILSDMLQIARPDSELYEEVANIISRKHIGRFIGIGPALYKQKKQFRQHKNVRSIFFKTTEDFLKNFHLITFENEAILLKGSRRFSFERIGTLLERKVHQTVMSINLSAITHNLNVYRGYTQPGVKLMAMVKAFSYGSGSYEIAHRLQYSGVDYLSVAYTEEGIELRKTGITMPIMVMSPDTESFDRMIAWKLEPEIYNMRSLNAFLQIAKTLKTEQYPIHLKLDTGMHRLGFEEMEVDELTEKLSGNDHVKVVSVFTHLSASEEEQFDDFTEQQAASFDAMYSILTESIGYKPLRHVCNSAGIIRHKNLHYDMVRLGLGLYGIDSTGLAEKQLMQPGTLKTSIAQIKSIPVGDSVGYNRKGISDKERRIATISIGYADGYPRSLSGTDAHVLIHNSKAPIVGNICMDMCMVDITDIPQAKEGDEVIVLGEQLTASQLAKWSGTISYEIMTGISQRVKRVYENES
ncbi:MAG: bifunctional UDP-N-acetylmuramoyl-tripeptide:D-alanyl-D-alanine ligase/alanine racemase [Chitinophagales bacterium]|nr:bifunctional UDP-N-acetylmuramoyl-tripeptide:D-alanyl-D-alanine ligase/alanine racemase [Chitinophagaceae bacterium]MCB9063593.1 bifunctional UDP-N-acetylmuramoyl-tripeptide:D-alanyl-D-alanine ligase/alanine racemase [Chitinophagales bacterium]